MKPTNPIETPAFKDWFGASKVRDESTGEPLVVFHGSGNTSEILSNGFSYDFVGLGNDQLGPGWYFTNNLKTAEGYTVRRLEPEMQKIGGEHSPGVLRVYLRLQNPIETSDSSDRWVDQLPDLGLAAARRMILASPDIKDPEGPLIDWGDLDSEGFEVVLARAVKAYVGPSYFNLANDFFRKDPAKFLRSLHDVTGYDGLVHRFSSGEVHYVAWFPETIKSADFNVGLFDLNCPDITDRTSPRVSAETKLGRPRPR